MTERRIRKTLRHSKDGINIVADIDAVINTNSNSTSYVSSSQTSSIVQTSSPVRKSRVQPTARRRDADGTTKGEQ